MTEEGGGEVEEEKEKIEKDRGRTSADSYRMSRTCYELVEDFSDALSLVEVEATGPAGGGRRSTPASWASA